MSLEAAASADEGGLPGAAPAPLTRAALGPLAALLLGAMAQQASELEPCAPGSLEDAASNCLCGVMHAAADALLPSLGPIIDRGLRSADWHHREAAVMACATASMWNDEDTPPPCALAFAVVAYPRASAALPWAPGDCPTSAPLCPSAGLVALLSGPDRDPSPYVRETAGYALWSAVQHEVIRASLCATPDLISIAPLAFALDDEPRVASQAAAVLSEIVGDEEALRPDERRAAWGLVPSLLRRIDAPDAAPGSSGAGPKPAALIELRDACDALLAALIQSGMVGEDELARLLEVRTLRGRGGASPSRSQYALPHLTLLRRRRPTASTPLSASLRAHPYQRVPRPHPPPLLPLLLQLLPTVAAAWMWRTRGRRQWRRRWR